MAAGGLMKEFSDEVTCSICLEYFRDPVMIECGHNFCWACLTQCWRESETAVSCPQCRENIQHRDFRLNRQLANLLEIAKKFQEEQRAGEGDKSGVCKEHQEPLKLFCNDDLASICVVCDRSKKHRNHSVLPMEEAFQEYKEIIQSYLQPTEKQRMKFLDHKTAEECRGQKHLAQLEQERKKSLSAFEEMQQFLEEEKSSWLAHLGDLEAKFKERQKENVGRLSKEITCLDELIVEIERKCQQPAREFLQDIKSTLERYKATQGSQLAELPLDPEGAFQICAERSSALEASVKNCKGSLDYALRKVNITLDPDTAHPCLNLHSNRMSVTIGGRTQVLPDKAERFDTELCVLGCEKFSSGTHKWVVNLEGDGSWAVGVARETVQRKGEIGLDPNQGIWALSLSSSHFSYSSHHTVSVLTSPVRNTLHTQGWPEKILVSLDMEKSCVAFSDANRGTGIFTFPLKFLSGDRICPFFCVSQGKLSLNQKPQSLGW